MVWRHKKIILMMVALNGLLIPADLWAVAGWSCEEILRGVQKAQTAEEAQYLVEQMGQALSPEQRVAAQQHIQQAHLGSGNIKDFTSQHLGTDDAADAKLFAALWAIPLEDDVVASRAKEKDMQWLLLQAADAGRRQDLDQWAELYDKSTLLHQIENQGGEGIELPQYMHFTEEELQRSLELGEQILEDLSEAAATANADSFRTFQSLIYFLQKVQVMRQRALYAVRFQGFLPGPRYSLFKSFLEDEKNYLKKSLAAIQKKSLEEVNPSQLRVVARKLLAIYSQPIFIHQFARRPSLSRSGPAATQPGGAMNARLSGEFEKLVNSFYQDLAPFLLLDDRSYEALLRVSEQVWVEGFDDFREVLYANRDLVSNVSPNSKFSLDQQSEFLEWALDHHVQIGSYVERIFNTQDPEIFWQEKENEVISLMSPALKRYFLHHVYEYAQAEERFRIENYRTLAMIWFKIQTDSAVAAF